MKDRIWEIDFIRGIAIILMVLFHLVYDLREFFFYNVEYLKGFWYYVGKLSAILFILIAGVSSTLSKNNFKRGIKIFCYGVLITLVTYLFMPEAFIKFGILHFLGISISIYYFFSKFKPSFLFFLATFIIFLGNIFLNKVVVTPYLFPLGLTNKNFVSVDFYPLFPWFGVFLYGVVLGKTLYFDKKSLLKNPPKYRVVSHLGKHSLLIYLLHQPILLAVLFLFLSIL